MLRLLLAIYLASYCTALVIPADIPKTPVKAVKRGYTPSECLSWVLNSEARGEPLKGSRAVLDVVYERMARKDITACQVVMEKGQFSGYKIGMKLAINEDMLTRLEEASRIEPVAKGCTHFHARNVSPTWAKSMTKCASVGGHIFFREK